MSDTKLIVTKDKLDKLATSISTKSGVTTPMTIAQMKAAVDNLACGTITQDADGYLVISGEGDATPRYSMDEIIVHNYPSVLNLTNPEITTLYPYQFAGSDITEVHAPYITSFTDGTPNIGIGVFRNCTKLTVVDMPMLIGVGSSGYQFAGCTSLEKIFLPNGMTGQHMFDGCTNLVTAVIRVEYETAANMNGQDFLGCTKLQAVDIKTSRVYSFSFQNCTVLKTLILRHDSLPTLSSINAFTNTPFASGGTGGTFYVPSALVSSYQSATNWSTILGYTNNRILPIEGSIYETQYADGTPISS